MTHETREIKFAIPAGTPAVKCRGCSLEIYWIKTAAGKNMPVDPDGTSHFVTCKDAEKFRRSRPYGAKGTKWI